MERHIRTIDDATAIVRDAGLAVAWPGPGTRAGFTDRLLLTRADADPAFLEAETQEYAQAYALSAGSAEDLDAKSRQLLEANAVAVFRLTPAGRRMADLIASARLSIAGRRALSALRSLATSVGRSLGARKQDARSLQLLATLLKDLREVCSVVPPGWAETCRNRYLEPQPGDWRRFAGLEKQLRQCPPHNERTPDIAVALLVALALDTKAQNNVYVKQIEERMRNVFRRGGAKRVSVVTAPARRVVL